MSQLKGFVKDPKKCLNVQINMKRGSAPVKGVNSEGVRVIGYADDVVPEAYLDADFNLVTQESLRNRLLDYALYCYMNDTGELDFNTAFRSILSTDYEDFNDKYGVVVDSHGKPVFPLSLKTAMFRLDSFI